MLQHVPAVAPPAPSHYERPAAADHEIRPPVAAGAVADLLREVARLTPEIVAAIQPCDLKPLVKARNVLVCKRRERESRLFFEAHGRWPDEPADPADADPTRPMRLGKVRYPAYRETLLRVCPWCTYCGRALTAGEATLDHVRPRARGGLNVPANLVLCCEHCNQAKGCDTPAGWAFRILAATATSGQLDELLERLRAAEAPGDDSDDRPDVVPFRAPGRGREAVTA